MHMIHDTSICIERERERLKKTKKFAGGTVYYTRLSSDSFSILRVILTVACRKRSPLRFFQRWLLLLFIGKFIPPIMSLSRRFVDVGEHENGGEYRMIYSLEGEYTIGSRCQHRLVYNLIHSLIIILCACVVCVCVSELCCYV